jgi:hypothetical protein
MYKFKNYSDLKLLKLENVHAILKTKKQKGNQIKKETKKEKSKELGKLNQSASRIFPKRKNKYNGEALLGRPV